MSEILSRIESLNALVASIEKEAVGLTELTDGFKGTLDFGKNETNRDIATWEAGTPPVFIPGLMADHQREAAVDSEEMWGNLADKIRAIRRHIEKGDVSQIKGLLEDIEEGLGQALIETGGLMAYLEKDR